MTRHNLYSKNKKILIIPDIHHKCDIAESIIKKNKPAYTIFLGDYFDDFYDDVEMTKNTLRWLEKSVQDKTRIHLIGNHDIQYIGKNNNRICTGYSLEKHNVIKQSKIDWTKLSMYCWIDSLWLCTHAGLSYDFLLDIQKNDKEDINKTLKRYWNDEHILKLTNQPNHRFFDVSTLRGGTAKVGGLLWCDYNEFMDIPGVNQIFGHTPANVVRYSNTTKKTKHVDKSFNSQKPTHEIKYGNGCNGSVHYCIDTALTKYVIVKNGKIVIMNTNDIY